jgi:hypothetical protein
VAAEQASTLPMVIALAIAILCFFGFLPILIRDSRRPLPLPPPKPVRVREPRSVVRALRRSSASPEPTAPAAPTAPVHVRPELGRRVALVATAVVVLSLWSGWTGRSRSARR